MRLIFTSRGWEDYESWSGERRILQRVNRMIAEALRDPGLGIGKPERLSRGLSGSWSRRTDQEHRLVHGVVDADLFVVQARGHH